MRLKAEQLPHSLNKLATVYLLSGDEPLQLNELADAVRTAARQAGFTNREVLTVDAHFDWSSLMLTGTANSLFADQTLLELRLLSDKIGTEGAKALESYCQNLPENTLLLIITPKLTASRLKTKWFKAVDQVAMVVQVWPLDGMGLIQWLQRRATDRGLNIETDAIKVLAQRIEGNLLAAAQEIEKLSILFGENPITKTDINDVITDHARYDIFKLTDCLLVGRVDRAFKILQSLRAESIAGSVVLWALAREIRLLMTIKIALDQGQSSAVVFKHHRLWDKQQQLISRALARLEETDLKQALLICAKADRQIKGWDQGDYWESFLMICVVLRNKVN